MKIYCNRQEKSDKEIFKQFEGKDLWLKVSCDSLSYVEGYYYVYIRIIGIVETKLYNNPEAEPTYIENYLVYNELSGMDIDEMIHDYPDYLLTDICNDRKVSPVDKFKVVKPIQILTTDEVWEILAYQDEE